MADRLIQSETLQSIADAIRSKDGTSASINVTDFEQRIRDIPSGDDTLGKTLDKSITNYTIPNNVTELPPFIFENCENLYLQNLSNITKAGVRALYNVGQTVFNLDNLVTFDGKNETVKYLVNPRTCTEFIAPKLTKAPFLSGYVSNVGGTITKINLRSVTTLGNSYLEAQEFSKVYLPKVTSSTTYSSLLKACKNLESVLFTANIGAGMFSRTYATTTTVGGNFTMLVIPNATPVSLSNVNSFAGTQISGGNGYIYVPRNTISTYEGMTNWAVVKDYAQNGTFKAIEDNLSLIESKFEYFKDDFPEFYE